MRMDLTEDAVRAVVSKKRKVKDNDASESGKIVSIRCENFMCHSLLELTLGDRVNFITGQNGSGKSAVITALQICLGMNAKKTQRADKLSSLIKQGSHGDATVRIKIANKGPGSFKHHLFGDYITVERTIKRSGRNQFKIYCSGMQVISEKAAEVTRITDHFNMMVDNPCCILDQETSKSFLRGDDQQKYKVFLDATLLARMDEFYKDEATTRDSSFKDFLKSINAMGEKLKADRDTKRLRSDELKGIGKLQDELHLLTRQQVWTLVQKAQGEWEHALADSKKAAGKFERLKAAHESVLGCENDSKDELADIKLSVNSAMEAYTEAERKSVALQHEVNRSQKHQNEVFSRQRTLKTSMDDARATIKKNELSLRQLVQESSSDKKRAEQQQREAKLRHIEQDMQNTDLEMRDIQAAQKSFDDADTDDEARAKKAKYDVEHMLNTIRDVEKNLQRLSQSSQDSNARFGDEVPRLLQLLNQNQSKFSEPPVLIGSHAKLNDMQWWKPVEYSLESYMKTFVVSTQKDFQTMRNLCSTHRLRMPKCIVSKFSRDRYNTRLVSDTLNTKNITSVLSVLTIDDTNVFNGLVDNAGIEKIALEKTSEKAYRLGSETRLKGFVSRCLDLDANTYSLKRGAEYKQSVPSWYAKRSQSLLFSTDTSTERIRLEEDLKIRGRNLNDAKSMLAECKSKSSERNNKLAALGSSSRKCEGKLRSLKKQKLDLEQAEQDADDDGDMNMRKEVLRNAIEVEKLKVEMLEDQVNNLDEEAQQAAADVKSQKAEADRLRQNEDRCREEAQAHQDRLKLVNEKFKSNLADVEKQKRKAELAEKIFKQKAGQAIELKLKYRESRQGALEFCGGVEVDMVGVDTRYTKARIQATSREIEKQKQLLTREGEDMETIVAESEASFSIAKKKYEGHKDASNNKKAVFEKFQAANTKRKEGWESLKNYCIKRMKELFSHYLKYRGYEGDIEIDNDEKKMSISWGQVTATEDNKGEIMHSDAGQLSGGEKSFTTLSLLLALGSVVDCPFRVMDEFDVFMDEQNRQTSLNLLVEMATAERSANKQFIFITPHDISCVGESCVVKKFKLRPNLQYYQEGSQEQHFLE